MKFILFFLALLTIPIIGSSQVDIGSWTSVQLNYKANDKLTIKLIPILRLNSNLSEYDNTSIDFALDYKFASTWSFQLLERHFFVPEGQDFEFLFFDLLHWTEISDDWQSSYRLRYHLGVDLGLQVRDFVRFQPMIKYRGLKKLKPFFLLDFFYGAADRQLSGMRYNIGADIPLRDSWKLNAQIWRQAGYNDFPIFSTYFIILNLVHNISYKTTSVAP